MHSDIHRVLPRGIRNKKTAIHRAHAVATVSAIYRIFMYEIYCKQCNINTDPKSNPKGVQTLRTQDTSDPRHFGPSKRRTLPRTLVSRHFGTGAEVFFDTSALYLWVR